MNTYGIQLKEAELLITRDNILAVSAEQQDNGEWAFFITFRNLTTGKTENVYIERQRQGMRTWADPRRMFDFMHDAFGITDGMFKIKPKRNN
ncbi:hypothetical protein FZI27_20165 [Cronobacter sakazakii]|nr:hypothetical protein FZI27_20165 [Cronobacter sakazakii]